MMTFLALKVFLICQTQRRRTEMADDTLDLVKDLIQTCKDGETGYTHAAGVTTDPQLKAYFSEQSLERARFGQELRLEAERLGDKPESPAASLLCCTECGLRPRRKIGLGDQSILNSVEQGEDSAKKAYQKALSSQLPSDLREIIQRQAESVLKAHDYVRDMRDGQAQPGEQAA